MKVIHGSLPQDNDPANFKTCPICGSVCFADMDTCFGLPSPFHRCGRDQDHAYSDRSEQ